MHNFSCRQLPEYWLVVGPRWVGQVDGLRPRPELLLEENTGT